VAYHSYSLSAGAYSSLKAFHVERNRVWLLVKLFPTALVLVSPFFTLARLSLQAWAGLSGRGATGRLAQDRSFLHLAGVTIRAYASALAGLPRVLRERRGNRRLRRMGLGAFLRLLREHRLTAREVAFKD
jgi:hypothetical protein